MRRIISILASAALVLALPATALGVSSSAAETLTVSSTITLTGVPATLSYGSAFASNRAQAPQFTATADTNNASGMKLSLTATDLTGASGTIDKSMRGFGAGAVTGCTLAGGASTWTTTSPKQYPGSGDLTVCTTTAPSTVVAPLTAYVNIPATAVPGTYSGTLTVNAVTNP